jgi:hypothetical protein
LHGFAGVAGGLLAELEKDFFQTGDVRFRLFEVIDEGLLELRQDGGIGHERERVEELLLAVVNVAQFLDQ